MTSRFAVYRPAILETVRSPTSSAAQLQLPDSQPPNDASRRKSDAPAPPTTSAPIPPNRSQRRKNRQRAALPQTNGDGSDGGSAGSRSDADQTPVSSRAVGDQRGSQRRRSARHRNYLNRSQLHEAIELPDGYGL